MSKPTTLYRLFDEDDELLYVGISSAFGHSPWANENGEPWGDDEGADDFRERLQDALLPRHGATTESD